MKNCLYCGHRNDALIEACEECGASLRKAHYCTIDDTLPTVEMPKTPLLRTKGNLPQEPMPGTTQFGDSSLLVFHFPQFISSIAIKPTNYIRIGRGLLDSG